MSKCGYCGFEGDIGEHMVLSCRTRSIPKDFYERMCVWMANEDNPQDFYEDFESHYNDIESDSLRQQRIEEEAEAWQKEEAFEIMYKLYQIYNLKDD